jgi:pimeloyl-ACP methyl ester carboxylesterase
MLLFVHGIWGNRWPEAGPPDPDTTATPYPDYFRPMLNVLAGSRWGTDLARKYKVYRFHYLSDVAGNSTRIIGEALRNHLDLIIQANPSWTPRILIVAHSMGGLVSRFYMNETDQTAAGNVRAGSLVTSLITLGTPHHGTPAANKAARVRLAAAQGWSEVADLLDEQLWGAMGCPSCARDVAAHNRRDLLFNNFDGRWNSNTKFIAHELLSPLIPGTFRTDHDSKLTAYAGAIGGNFPLGAQPGEP